MFSIILIAALAAAQSAPVVHSTAEAIAMADAASTDGAAGRFEMTVVTGAKMPEATYLNSNKDYRRPDELTLEIAPSLARTLTKRYGAPPESYFRGKHVVVDGTVRRKLIVNMRYGRPVSASRWQHVISVRLASQIVSVD